MPCDAQSLIVTAYSNGYAKLSQRDLKEAIVAAACAGGGGGGSGGGATSGAGAPSAAPSGDTAIYIDTNTGAVYYYYSGAWH